MKSVKRRLRIGKGGKLGDDGVLAMEVTVFLRIWHTVLGTFHERMDKILGQRHVLVNGPGFALALLGAERGLLEKLGRMILVQAT
jgi:hypothetical protein